MTLVEKYLSYLSYVRRYSARTVEIYRESLDRFAQFCSGEDILGMLAPSVLRSYEVDMIDRQGMSAKTVSLHFSVLSGFCRFLIREGILQSNPVRLVKRPKIEKRLPEFYRDESVKEYFDGTKGAEEFGDYDTKLRHLIISILVNTGIRRSELVSLKRSSVDLSRRILRVSGKGDKMREIPLIPSLCEEIVLYLQSADELENCGKEPGDPLLVTSKGRALYPVYVDRVVKGELAKVKSITGRRSPHVLRHTLATELLCEGSDLNSIKELLGHSSLAATQVYTHNSIERLKSVYVNAHPRAKSGGKNGHSD